MLVDQIDPVWKAVTINREHVHLLWEQVKIAISKSIPISDYNIPQLTAQTCTVLINLGWSECSWPRFLGILIKLGYQPLIQFWLRLWFLFLTSDPLPSFPPAFSFGFVSWCQYLALALFLCIPPPPPDITGPQWPFIAWRIRHMDSCNGLWSLHLFFILALCRGNLIMSLFCLESFNCL